MEPMNMDYAGALFDGEGSISICKRKGKVVDNARLVMGCGNCNRQVIVDFMELMGVGSIHATRPSKNGYICYNWHAHYQKGVTAAKLLLPYVRIKRELLTIGIDFAGRFSAMGKSIRSSKPGGELRDRLVAQRNAYLAETMEQMKDARDRAYS